MSERLEKIDFVNVPQKVFQSLEHFKRVRAAIISALSISSGRKKGEKQSSYLINRMVVKFTDEVDAEEISIDYENGRIVLEAPKVAKNSQMSETDLRLYYYSNLIKYVEAMATIGITHIYLVLDDDGRKEVDGQKSKSRKKKK